MHYNLYLQISEADLLMVKENLDAVEYDSEAIFYTSGYVVHHLTKIKSCKSCRLLLISNDDEESYHPFFTDINRSKLLYPSHLILHYTTMLFGIFQIIKHRLIEKKHSPRSYILNFFQKMIIDDENLKVNCNDGHSFSVILKMAAFSFINCILKNHAKSFGKQNLCSSNSKKIKKLNSKH